MRLHKYKSGWRTICGIGIAAVLCGGCSLPWRPAEVNDTVPLTNAPIVSPGPVPVVDEQPYIRLGAGGHWIFRTGTGEALLMTGLIQPNESEINEKLVDSNALLMDDKELNAIQEDPNAQPVDNILPDGRYLIDDFVTKQNEIAEALIEQSIEIRRIKDGELGEPLNATKVERSLEQDLQSLRLPLWEVEVEAGRKVLLPRNPERFPISFHVMLGGERLLVYNDQGLWGMDAYSDDVKRLTSDSYQGLAIDQLKTDMAKERPTETLYWIGGGMPDPDGQSIAYISNRRGWKEGGNSIYVFDLAAGEERWIADSPAETIGFGIVGWLDRGRILCEARNGNEIAYSIIDVRAGADGRIIPLEHPESSTDILDVRQGYIVYATPLEGGIGEYVIARINDQGTLREEVAAIPIDGWIRIQNRGISPEGSYNAFIYAPNDVQNRSHRYVSLYDMTKGREVQIKEVPGAPNAIIHSFGWANDNWLAMELEEKTAEGEVISTWLYKPKE